MLQFYETIFLAKFNFIQKHFYTKFFNFRSKYFYTSQTTTFTNTIPHAKTNFTQIKKPIHHTIQHSNQPSIIRLLKS